MDPVMSWIGSLLIPVAVAVLVLVALSVVARLVKNNYIKVPPYQVAVISGRKRRMQVRDADGKPQEVTVGYRLVKGGATLVIPFLERKDELDLREITIPDLVVKDAVTAKGVFLTVKAVANIKIGSEDTLLSNAVERLLGKSPDDIKRMAYETLEAHLRSMLGTLTIEEVNADRATFQQRMISESQSDLAKLGLKIDVLAVKELSDTLGYLEALGKKRTAEVKRDAAVGSAQADRESTIQSTTAMREGEVEKQKNLALAAEAEKDKNVKVAEYVGNAEAAKATAAQAGPLATAEARKAVVEKEQEVELTKTRKMTEVAEAEAARTEKELLATTVRPAEAKRAAAIAEAEGKARAIEIEAEATKKKKQLEGEGEAAAKKAVLLAEAEGTKAKLLAEAEGVLKKAAAYKELNQAGQLLQILEAAQNLVPNSIEKFADVMKAAASPLGNADKIVLVDSGGNNNKDSAIQRFADTAPNMIFNLIQKATAMGLDLSGLFAKAGVIADGEVASAVTEKDKK